MLSENDPQPRLVKKRQPNAANLTAREAIGLVQPTNARLADWQMQLARHAANGERLMRRHEAADALVTALDRLKAEVASERKRLEAVIAEAPEEVAGNSRVQDCRKALTLVDMRIASLISALGRTEPDRSAAG